MYSARGKPGADANLEEYKLGGHAEGDDEDGAVDQQMTRLVPLHHAEQGAVTKAPGPALVSAVALVSNTMEYLPSFILCS